VSWDASAVKECGLSVRFHFCCEYILRIESPQQNTLPFDANSSPWKFVYMPIAHSKITTQGQVSVPAEVRKKLGVGPGSILEWIESNNQVVVRRVGRNTSTDIHEALFTEGLPKASIDVKEGIRKHLRKKHARR
jgi:antitoxin PrlF